MKLACAQKRCADGDIAPLISVRRKSARIMSQAFGQSELPKYHINLGRHMEIPAY